MMEVAECGTFSCVVIIIIVCVRCQAIQRRRRQSQWKRLCRRGQQLWREPGWWDNICSKCFHRWQSDVSELTTFGTAYDWVHDSDWEYLAGPVWSRAAELRCQYVEYSLPRFFSQDRMFSFKNACRKICAKPVGFKKGCAWQNLKMPMKWLIFPFEKHCHRVSFCHLNSFEFKRAETKYHLGVR